MKEVWKDIYFEENGVIWDYRDIYQISNIGRVKSLNYNRTGKEKILKAVRNEDGYLFVGLYKNGKSKMFLIHRLVAFMFISNDDQLNKVEINHIDENKENNSASNLEWCTREYNNNHGTRNEKSGKSQSKKVIGYSLTTTKVIVLQSTKQAKKFGFNQGNIYDCCNGKRKSHNGYRWYYLDDKKC